MASSNMLLHRSIDFQLGSDKQGQTSNDLEKEDRCNDVHGIHGNNGYVNL